MSMILMLGMRHDHVALYFGTCFFGLFISSITPTALSLAEQYIDVTCKYCFVDIEISNSLRGRSKFSIFTSVN